MSKYLWVALGGSLGALARYALSSAIAARVPSAFPWGTLAINVTGSIVLGFIATVGSNTGLLPPTVRTALTAGFLGAFTTFSTWSLETLRLLQSGSWSLAALNVAGSMIAGIAGAWMGVTGAKLLS